ncbi:ABC transporter permease [Variovorax saccharolyticus]|uniref:ABC transporter permease n=1 Tax=Variovorax saccharolyticus TaxID=3053516 RepID=UPI002579185D|nr:MULTISPECIES: ABC transporter permease [unclassified Variovorax]MDM0020971.1 ABC transporter permease [Variovorax sp. J22R187]MDM0025335.1 ABC transporter permease [Variovorax sp. J31P216]
MLAFLLRRIVATLPVLAVVALIVFLMTRLAPGDPAASIVGDNATTANLAQVRTNLGLNDPLPVQFGRWGSQLLRGDLGESFFMKKPVVELIGQRIEPTLALAGVTLLLTLLIAVPLGVLAAWRHGGWLDRALMGFSALGFSVPVFVIGYLLIWFFALKLQWLPVQGYNRIADGFWPWLRNLVMPAVALSVIYVALIARVTRAAVAEAMTEDYIRTARAKGIPEVRVLMRHALANAAVPIVTVIGIGIALLIGGVVVTESVFAIPGLGSLTVDAVLSRDFPLIQGITLFFSVIYVLVNLLVDLSYLVFDPRIRY